MDEARAHDTEADWASAWAAALDALELSLDETERLLRGEAPASTPDAPITSDWTPPALEGPMPVDLRTRALALHHRQQRVLRATAEAAAALRRQAELTSRMSTAPAAKTPVYLDVTA
jgi:hypothetical protein